MCVCLSVIIVDNKCVLLKVFFYTVGYANSFTSSIFAPQFNKGDTLKEYLCIVSTLFSSRLLPSPRVKVLESKSNYY